MALFMALTIDYTDYLVEVIKRAKKMKAGIECPPSFF